MDLDRKCSECGGSGVVQSAEWQEWWERWERNAHLAPLDRREEEPDGPEEIVCGVCNGRQRVPTEEGEQLLAFVRRHL